jgi:hypothetical protein
VPQRFPGNSKSSKFIERAEIISRAQGRAYYQRTQIDRFSLPGGLAARRTRAPRPLPIGVVLEPLDEGLPAAVPKTPAQCEAITLEMIGVFSLAQLVQQTLVFCTGRRGSRRAAAKWYDSRPVP